MIKTAVNGTLNVLRACTKSKTVKRVIVTSSTAAVAIDESKAKEQHQYIDETCWTDVDLMRTKQSPAWVEQNSEVLIDFAWVEQNFEVLQDLTFNSCCCCCADRIWNR